MQINKNISGIKCHKLGASASMAAQSLRHCEVLDSRLVGGHRFMDNNEYKQIEFKLRGPGGTRGKQNQMTDIYR